MTDSITSNGVPQATWDERFSALEAKFATLAKEYQSVLEKPRATTDTSTVQSAELPHPKPPEVIGNHTTSRANVVINRFDPETGERRDYQPQDATSSSSDPTDTTHAFTLRRSVYEDPEVNEGELDIRDMRLWKLLRGLLGHYPYHIFHGPPVTINSPYEPLILYWNRLEQATKEAPKVDDDKQARSDLQLLLETISNSSGDPKLDKYFKRDFNKEQKSVSFETLWTIFPPGSLIYGRPFLGQDQIFIVKDNKGPWPYRRRGSPNEQGPWILICWIYDWDGSRKRFKRMPLSVEFEHFEGYKPITSLPYYPWELNENRAMITDKLIKRGKDYRKFCTTAEGSRMFDYKGEAIFARRGFAGVRGDIDQDDDAGSWSNLDLELEVTSMRKEPTKTSNRLIESRVMVDFESYYQYCPSPPRVGSLVPDNEDTECGCIDCRENKALSAGYRTRFDEGGRQKGDWEDEQYLCCPPRVLGYILRDKQWAQLQVTSLEDIPEKDPDNAWASRLKLDDETKNMILNLVTGHGASDSQRLDVDDIVARKGKGLVMLLYGPPGVGKTLTAETAAIAARKPLFAISVADVGTEARRVEANLKKIFDLATSWQAILLIDEADVFLEKRGSGMTSNTERNALVSVFLRVLEYYQGILVLTTNQIAHFDVAVQSRVHIAIKYGYLGRAQSMAIFEGFLGPLTEQGLVKDMESIRSWLNEDVTKMGLDGRQIRNVVTSALNVARAQGKRQLEQRDIKKVLEYVKDFKDDIVKQFEKYKGEQAGIFG